MGILARALERRSISVVPANLWRSTLGGWVTDSGVQVTPERSLQSTAVLACVRVLAETVAALPLHIYRRRSDGGKERATDHPLYSLLHDAPNDEMTSYQFRETMMLHLTTWGNAYAQIQRNGAGRPIALWPLRPDRMEVRRVQSTGELVYLYRKDGEAVLLMPNEVLHIAGLAFDGLVGYSPIALARQAVGLALATEEFGARFFSNDARPGGVLEHPALLDDEAYKRLQKSWEERHSGLSGSHRVAILEEGMKFHEIGIPPEDAQFLQTRRFQVNEIARIYRVPPHLIGDLERSTYSNIEQQSIEFVVHTIGPWLVRWEQRLNMQLLFPREQDEYFVEHLVNGLLRGDIRSRYEAYAIGRQWGWLSVNDILRLENMNPVPDGDTRLIPLNMVPVGDGQAQRSIAPGKIERRNRYQGRRSVQESHREVFADVARRVLRRERNDVMRLARKHLTRRDEGTFWQALEEFWSNHWTFIRDQFRPVMRAYMDLVARAAADEVGEDVPAGFGLDAFAEAYLNAYSARHIGKSRKAIERALTEAAQRGDDPIDALQAAMDQAVETRSENIATNETTRANGAVSEQVFAALGVLQLRWVAIGDNCPFCTQMNGRTVEIGSFFLGDGESLDAGDAGSLSISSSIRHPPLHDGCDCMIIPG